ncbi:MAG TPA: hypothetical protein VHE55_19105 [Fimbriimonadaceae bacterium]|nr:hypothetical protein [Fimbriimonadaceae bacterium]
MFISALLTLALVQTPKNLKIDPLMIAQAAEAWSVIGSKDNPVWPGWNAKETPILIYMPDVQDVLINHPKPPAGFAPYDGPIHFPGGKIWIKDGPTITPYDGQNTSIDVNGVGTLVLADTLSTRRQNLQGLVEQARGGTGDMKDAIDGFLHPNPYDGLAMVVHEAFHVYQGRRAPGKGGTESDLVDYPSLSVENNVGFALEGETLRAEAQAKTAEERRRLAVRWLAIRRERRKHLSPSMTAYEDGTEFNEGTAKYTEYRLFQALEGRQPSHDMWLVQSFHGFSDLSAERSRLLDHMVDIMSGKVNVNNDPYGASPVRFRLYFSGMGIGALLDSLGAQWHEAIFQPKVSLTSLAEQAIHATPQELDAAWSEVVDSARYKELTTEKDKLAKDGEAYIQKAVQEFDSAPGQLVIDYSGLTKPRVGLAFTPFGILRIDDSRSMYRLLPVRGIVNDLNFAEDSARPVLQDRMKKQLVIQLTGAMTEADLDKAAPGWRNGPVKLDSLQLPGVSLKKVSATIRLEGKWIVLVPAS